MILPEYLHETYFKNDPNMPLERLRRMKGITELMNDNNPSGALLFGLLTLKNEKND